VEQNYHDSGHPAEAVQSGVVRFGSQDGSRVWSVHSMKYGGKWWFLHKKLPSFPGFLLLSGRRRMRKFRISVKYPPDTFSVTGA